MGAATEFARCRATSALYDPRNLYDIAPLRAWFADAARAIADRFDRRNGNTYWADSLATASEDLALFPYP